MTESSKTFNKPLCSKCIHRFKCLAEHHIPDNYGLDCLKYEESKQTTEIHKIGRCPICGAKTTQTGTGRYCPNCGILPGGK